MKERSRHEGGTRTHRHTSMAPGVCLRSTTSLPHTPMTVTVGRLSGRRHSSSEADNSLNNRMKKKKKKKKKKKNIISTANAKELLQTTAKVTINIHCCRWV
ncbi:unnamed protein product [Pleuronectes platessa]|uniref:Uncharacterized protein n=1 Tax=Pleuronectes platessa TaxID=8262 RepID=A0A9N7V6D2_PLEPL|nr:unnamed protein product [Pleuronectes platessa]